ncbi:hypothetical protein HUJ04_005706 [Dendroctonus ponderosae]|nr:hypothetical protein HUJ04_005706 [Dendroctonus ponderosae]
MRFRMRIGAFLQLLLVGLVVVEKCTAKQKSKSVTTLLEAKWSRTPLVLEVSEFLADENPDLYWSFIDSISLQSPALNQIENERKRYNVLLEHAARLLSPSQLAVLKLSLSLHIYSPKVQMFQQISTELSLPKCQCVADVGGQFSCDLKEIEKLIEQPSNVVSNAELFNVDTHYPGSENRSLVAVLYGELGTQCFSHFHALLKTQAVKGGIDYVIRHYHQGKSEPRLRLSGYGVELQMKSTEYKSQDDSEVQDSEGSAEASQEDEELEIDGFDFAKLKQLFPDLRNNLDKFKQHLEDSSNELAALKVWEFQELSLQAAERIMNAPKDEALKVFTNIAQNFPMQAKALVKTVVNPDLKMEMKINADIFGSTLNLQPSDTALFINGMFYDIDVIDIYSILDVLRQELKTMEGLHALGLSNGKLRAVLHLDFSESSGSPEFAIDIRDSAINWLNDIEQDTKFRYWATSLMDLLRPTFPGMLRQIRKNLYNLVLIIDPTDTSLRPLLKIVESFVVHATPIRTGLVFRVNSSKSVSGLDDAGVAMLCAFNYVQQSKGPIAAFSFLRSMLGSTERPQVSVEDVKRELSAQFSEDPADILDEDSDYIFGRQFMEVIDYLMDQPNVMPRLNDRVLNRERSFYLDMSGKATSTHKLEELLQLSRQDMTATAIDNLRYFTVPKRGNQYRSLTYWVVGDLDCPKGRKLLLDALEHLKSESDIRVSFLPNVNGNKANIFNKVVLAALETLSSGAALSLVLSLLRSEDTPEQLQSGHKLNIPSEVWSKVSAQELNLKMLRVYSQRVLDLKEEQRAIVANGRVLGPLDDGELFTNEDFSLLERFTSASYLDKISKAFEGTLDEDDDDKPITSDTILKLEPLLLSKTASKSRFDITYGSDEYSAVKIPARRPDLVAFDLVAVVDPVSRGAQKLGPILQVLHELLNCNIKLFLNSVEKNSDMPVKSFYRFVLEPEIQFSEDGKQLPGPIARFNNMPTSPLLTQNYHVPENWLVEVVRSVYDLDNIRLENSSGSPPRGLQITLGTVREPVIVDTIVMANLGYFQLKANPGSWLLKLRQGRSADIYDIVSHDGHDMPPNSTDIKVLISQLRSNIVKLRVQKKPDKFHMDLLSFASKEEESEEKLNIFSVASGHLYERFLKIMMLSVLKQTKTPVKFWFLKNYLSPQIKDFLPYMAKEYGFEYELVQYKWPRWLTPQTEKQRIIWGYKILFLDVLFPLDVKKIIFVDADQVVRTDLKELRDFDLNGAPYGYTPFCDSRREMDGFRFWKQGYWRNHLQGRKYHISALYVVDLKKFRRIAAGDRLRGQYQALSQDPNSLSNLDQDLPNNMIHQVAIKSLPAEWLWCETWCDDASKAKAKTIDLCNNPLTKEAKLSAAMRILPEWKGYDDEVRELQKKIDSGVLDEDPAADSGSAGRVPDTTDRHTEL